MKSASKSPIRGQYMHPLITEKTKNSDPWERNYFQPPDLKPFVPRSYPLIDIRLELARPGSSPSDILKKYGFTTVKDRSAFVDELGTAPVEDEDHIAVYHREIEDLVKRTLGAKEVFVTASVFRLGERFPSEMKLPTGVKSAGAKNPDLQNGAGAKADGTSKGSHLTGQAKLSRSSPIRVPHMDFTPLGARQTIRFQARDIFDAATIAGVIAFEDQICKNQPFKASMKGSDALIEAQYNAGGKLGPRYAAYSIWRPLCKVIRDPITLAPRGKAAVGDSVFWPYDNKNPGPKELGGDFLKEYAMCGVKEHDSAAKDGSDSLKWYYVCELEPADVLFIQLFDSASLGPESEHARAPWHASPEVGEVDDNHPRESIDVRVMVFW